MIINQVDTRNVNIIYDALELKVRHEVLKYTSTKQLVQAAEALHKDGFDLSETDVLTYINAMLLTERNLMRMIIANPVPEKENVTALDTDSPPPANPEIEGIVGEPYEPKNKNNKPKKKEPVN